MHWIAYILQIAVTCCCGFPCGICAIINDNEANTMVGVGDLESAWESHNTAAQCRVASIFTGVIIIGLVIYLHFLQ